MRPLSMGILVGGRFGKFNWRVVSEVWLARGQEILLAGGLRIGADRRPVLQVAGGLGITCLLPNATLQMVASTRIIPNASYWMHPPRCLIPNTCFSHFNRETLQRSARADTARVDNKLIRRQLKLQRRETFKIIRNAILEHATGPGHSANLQT